MSSKADGNPGLNKLARKLQQRMREISESNVGNIESDFGVVGSDGSLILHTFPVPIPKGEYFLGRMISGITVTNLDGTHVNFPQLNAGDMVLVAWVHDEVVVIDVVVKS